jgi:hypothetical protein
LVDSCFLNGTEIAVHSQNDSSNVERFSITLMIFGNTACFCVFPIPRLRRKWFYVVG